MFDNFPFYIKDQLIIAHEDAEVANNEELIQKVQKGLGYLGMKGRRIAPNEIYYSQSFIMVGLGQNSALNNLSISVEYGKESIEINFKSKMTAVLIIGLVPLLVLLFPTQNLVPDWIWYLSFPILLIGFAAQMITLGNIRKILKDQLIK